MSSEIVIDQELKSFIESPSSEELEILEEQIKNDGVRDPLVVWDEENILIDGHTRLSICKKHGIEYNVKRLSFPDRDHVLSWMAKNQLGRRNLTAKQISYLRGFRFLHEQKETYGYEGRVISGSDSEVNSYTTKDKNRKAETSKKIAKESGVSPRTVQEDAKYTKAVDIVSKLFDDPTLVKTDILSGTIKISKKAIKEIAEVAECGDKESAKDLFKEAIAPKPKKAKPNKPVETDMENNELPEEMDKSSNDFIL